MMIARQPLCALLAIGVLAAAGCNEKEPAEPQASPPWPVAAIDAAPEAAPVTPAPVAIQRDWLCPVLATTERLGFFGDAKIARQRAERAGIRSVQLRSDADGALVLAFLAEDDIDNKRGLTTREASPARSTHVFRMAGDTWQDLGRPFQFMGWDARLDLSIGDGPLHVAVEAGIGDVRRSLVASCEASRWQQAPRYTSKNFEAAGMVASDDAQAMGNIEIVRGPAGTKGAACQEPGGLRGPDVPLRVVLPGFHEHGSAAIDLAEPGDCRVARGFVAAVRGDAIAVAYELCSAGNGDAQGSKSACQIATVWHDGESWRRLPAIDSTGDDETETQHAVALGEVGPVLAVASAKKLRVHQAEGTVWQELPDIPGAACQRPVALHSDPPRIIARSCTGPDLSRAYLLGDTDWRLMAKALPLEAPAGAQGMPTIAGHWIGETAYLAVGYHGAPVVRVFASAEDGWQQVLQAQVDPNPPAAPVR